MELTLFLSLHHRNQVSFTNTAKTTHSHLLAPSSSGYFSSWVQGEMGGVEKRDRRGKKEKKNRQRWWGWFSESEREREKVEGRMAKKKSFTSPIHQHNVERTRGNPIERFSFLFMYHRHLLVLLTCLSLLLYKEYISRIDLRVKSREKSKNRVVEEEMGKEVFIDIAERRGKGGKKVWISSIFNPFTRKFTWTVCLYPFTLHMFSHSRSFFSFSSLHFLSRKKTFFDFPLISDSIRHRIGYFGIFISKSFTHT